MPLDINRLWAFDSRGNEWDIEKFKGLWRF